MSAPAVAAAGSGPSPRRRRTVIAAVFVAGLLVLAVGAIAPFFFPVPESPPTAADGPIGPIGPIGKMTATASSAEGEHAAGRAVDGDAGTRWSSAFTDSEWLRIDLGNRAEIAGLRIQWESAYGKAYDVLLSDDGERWTRVYACEEGDGGGDEFFFGRRAARFVKLQGVKRGTGWGYSIFEVTPLSPDDLPTASSASSAEGEGPERIFDGDTSTAWRSAGGPAEVTIDLRAMREVGGLEILWGDAVPDRYAVEATLDGERWTPLATVEQTDGERDLVFFRKSQARHLRIRTEGAAGASIREAVVKGGEAEWTPARHFESLSYSLPRGALPGWVRRVQTMWTIVGVPDDAEESLLGEDATVEPLKDAFSVMPYLEIDGRVLTARDLRRTHALADGHLPIPTVHLETGTLALDVTALSEGSAGASRTLVRYRVANGGAETASVRLALAVWPLQLNPPWQYGGAAPIRSARLDARSVLTVHDRVALIPLTPPESAAVAAPESGHPYAWTRAGALPASRAAADSRGTISGLYRWALEIPPGGRRDVVLCFPLHDAARPPAGDGAAAFETARAGAERFWRSQLEGWRLRAPFGALDDVAKTSLAYMILNRDYHAPQPGPRNYAKAWMRDGAISTMTYLRFGRADVARGYMDWFVPLVGGDGFVPFLVSSKTGETPDWAGDWKEFDSQGEFVYAVRAYYDLTRDMARLRGWFGAVERAVAYMVARIEERRTDKHRNTEFFGILPESNSHEGYFPGVHSYWDDFWALRGLKDAAAIADLLGNRAAAARFRAEEARLREDFANSMKAVIRKRGLRFVPASADKGDFDPTSTSIALTACGEAPFLLGDSVLAPALRESYRMYIESLAPRFDHGEKGTVWAGYTPYEARNVEALVMLGRREDAIRLLDFLIGPSMRPRGWNVLPEVVHFDPATPSYIGDMPHTWVAADLTNAIRSIFLVDEDGLVQIALGVPAGWLEGSAEVGVENLPTRYGTITYRLRRAASGEVLLEASGTATPGRGFVFRHPFGARLRAASVDGVPVPAASDGVAFARLPAVVALRID